MVKTRKQLAATPGKSTRVPKENLSNRMSEEKDIVLSSEPLQVAVVSAETSPVVDVGLAKMLSDLQASFMEQQAKLVREFQPAAVSTVSNTLSVDPPVVQEFASPASAKK